MSGQPTPPTIAICPLCSKTPAATGGNDLVWWCCHTGNLVSQSQDTGSAFGISNCTADEARQFLKNRGAFYATDKI